MFCMFLECFNARQTPTSTPTLRVGVGVWVTLQVYARVWLD